MDPNQLPSGNATSTNSQSGKEQPISLGHPEAERFAVKKAERVGQVEQKKVEQQTVKTVEASNNLELSKEILPGVEEKHHPSEPIVLPSQIQLAGVSSTPIPIESMTFKPDPVVLPLTESEIKKGLHVSVWYSIRWLSEWCVKQLKEAHLLFKRQGKEA